MRRIPIPRFILRDPFIKGLTSLHLILRYNNERFTYNTGESVHPKYWDKASRRIKNSKAVPDSAEINHRLDELEYKIKDWWRERLREKGFCNLEGLKAFLNGDHNSEHIHLSLLKFIPVFMEESEGYRKKDTIKVFKSLLHRLIEYEQSSGSSLDWDEITLDFYQRFIGTLMKRELATNTIDKYIKTLKLMMNEGLSRGYHNNLAFKHKKFARLHERVSKIYLPIHELEKIYDLNLSDNKTLNVVRDLFLIGAYTGLRYSDYSSIQKENIRQVDNGWVIDKKARKTGGRVVIPLHPMVVGILEKYDRALPSGPTIQTTNRLLKEIGQLANINEPIIIEKTIGGQWVSNSYLKYQLISSHTARRSFATNAYLCGVKSIGIMAITGHSTEKAFLGYIQVTAEENAQHLLDHKFFQ
ncbi:MAG: site-specific integrase [Flavobacteriales bacterium]|nr:site-specific integrase [Flavobacteriales bacterium]